MDFIYFPILPSPLWGVGYLIEQLQSTCCPLGLNNENNPTALTELLLTSMGLFLQVKG